MQLITVQAVTMDRMKLLGHIFVLMEVIIAATLGCAGEERPLRDSSERMSYLDNGTIKVGVDLGRGGSIGYLADVKTGGNVVNVHDLGRWIGQSYYAGPKPFGTAHPAWKDWPWNPVSAGDAYGNASKLLEKKNDGKTLYVKSIPMQWALKNVPGDCTFETWITLKGRTVQVRNSLTNQRKDEKQYPALDQELPAVYAIGKLHRLMTYTGDNPFADKPLTEIPKRPANLPRTSFFSIPCLLALQQGVVQGQIHGPHRHRRHQPRIPLPNQPRCHGGRLRRLACSQHVRHRGLHGRLAFLVCHVKYLTDRCAKNVKLIQL